MKNPYLFMVDDEFGIVNNKEEKLTKEELYFLKDRIELILNEKNNYLEVNGFVYFVRDVNGLVKIGCTSNIRNRKYGLKSRYGDLEVLRIISCERMVRLEQYFHLRFKSKNIYGEWFELSKEDVMNYKLGQLEKTFKAEDVTI